MRAMDVCDNQFIPSDPRLAWLLGRLMIAEVRMGNHDTAALIAEFIIKYLQSEQSGEVTPENTVYTA